MQGTLGRLRVGRPNEHKSKLFFQSKQQKKNKAGAQAIQESGSNWTEGHPLAARYGQRKEGRGQCQCRRRHTQLNHGGNGDGKEEHLHSRPLKSRTNETEKTRVWESTARASDRGHRHLTSDFLCLFCFVAVVELITIYHDQSTLKKELKKKKRKLNPCQVPCDGSQWNVNHLPVTTIVSVYIRVLFLSSNRASSQLRLKKEIIIERQRSFYFGSHFIINVVHTCGIKNIIILNFYVIHFRRSNNQLLFGFFPLQHLSFAVSSFLLLLICLLLQFVVYGHCLTFDLCSDRNRTKLLTSLPISRQKSFTVRSFSLLVATFI